MYVRAVLCHCRRRLEADDEEALQEVVRDHLMRDHPSIRPTDEQVAEIVSTRAYDIEYAELYVGANGLADGFSEDYVSEEVWEVSVS